MEKNLKNLVQNCFKNNYFKLFDFLSLFDEYDVENIFYFLTRDQDKFLLNNIPVFKEHIKCVLPSKYYFKLTDLQMKIIEYYGDKQNLMQPATEEEQKSVSDGIKSISKPVVDNKEGENIMKKSNIVFTDEEIAKLNDAYLRSDNSEMALLQELSMIMKELGKSSFDTERKAIRDLIELNAVICTNVMFSAFDSDTISKLKEIYNQMQDELLNHLNLDYLVNFEEKFKDKLHKEFNEFIKSVQEEQKTNPNYAIQHAYEICWKQEIVYVIDNINYKNIDIKLKNKLLNTNGVLDLIYQEWLDKDSSDINDQLYDIITEI